ncbi:MAG: pyrimidine/purine nucleoside phosphorylase [Akkermansiaceae bacterium]|nr:pyrimidine/purine nucleoside phosphorylase [Akkermansiaceae bacterium]MDP4646453.1 pyrimidine/purine nucleoside phosphorylase [Akkermansiaceae bacterium]MDP4720520.1 pyrimidine/purine nucleoside phosphorylase [Akkermansiaceae bacterium]MDP4780060.1 pyrimidine/purine nucleoside phosphorylase [Akkermansiaceae bacterium]MDP4847654.1 pyrimidine/purine nucleoside phosphorylase [Akkermansiaceae bacterium]
MNSFSNVTVDSVANVYFDGKVVSHSVTFPDGSRKTLGIIYPGTYKFNTGAPELMEIIDGSCEVTVNGSGSTRFVPTDESFEVPANSGFTITVNAGICQYICSFL